MSKITLIIIIFLLSISWASPAFALSLSSTALGVSDGLSQSNVTTIVEDSDGYIWIGTVNGLNRYDGQEFKHYFPTSDNGLPSAFIRSLFISSNGTMYIGTEKGLAFYDQQKGKITAIKSDGFAQNDAVWSISETNSLIIIGMNNKVHVTKEGPNKGELKLVDTYAGNYNGVKQVLAIGTDFYIRNYDGKVINLSIPEKEIANNVIEIAKIDSQLFLFKKNGVYSASSQDKPINNSSYVSVSNTDNYIVGLKDKTIFNLKNLSKPKKIGSLNISSQPFKTPTIYRGLTKTFISDQNKGLVIISDSRNLVESSIPKEGNIWSLIKDASNSLIISSDSAKINIYDNEFNLKKSIDTGILGPKSVINVNKKLYIASANGLHELDVDTNKVTLLVKGSFFTLKLSDNKKNIITGSTSGNLITFNIEENTAKTQLIDEGNPIFSIETYGESIYIASQGGIFQLKNNIISPLYNDHFVISLAMIGEELYFGTGTSLKKINLSTSEITTIYTNNKPIFSIGNNNNTITLASINEIILINKDSGKITKLDKELGTQVEYNANAIYSNDTSTLVGGVSGVSIISTKKLQNYINSRQAPIVNLKELLIFNIPEKSGGNVLSNQFSRTYDIKLKYSDYPFTINFNSPGIPQNSIEYVYQMQGLSDSLIQSKGTNSATYTNLSPGEYKFSIYAIDPITGKHGETRELKVEITPPWWLSDWAKSLYLLCILLISILIIKIILRRRDIQKQIAKSEERLKLSLWGSGDEMWDWDIETGQIYRSNIWGSLEFPQDGQRSGNAAGESNIHPMDQERVREALNKHFYGETDHFEAAYRVKSKASGWIWILDRAKIVERDENDNALRMTGTIKNITNFKQAEEQLKLFERAIQNISEGMFILDNDFRFVEVNEACCAQIMLSKTEFIGSLFNFDLYPDSYSEQIRTILRQQGRWNNEVEAVKGDNTSFLMELSIDAIYDEQGELSHYVGVFSDISRRKQQEEELRKLTNNDLLTNLPNRSNLIVTLGNLVKRDTHHTLMVLDLDNFKKINDSLGHQVGDELLIQAAERIEAAVPGHTSIYRLGGDEFAILIDKNPDIGTSAIIAKDVIHAFENPFILSHEKVVVGVSIGIVLYPEDDQNEQALLRKADIAMYHAKSGGGNRYQFYSESLNKNAIRQLEVENLIREGIKSDLFEVYYQPKINLKSGLMAGMEALVRLNHPEQGLIPPNRFIPLAEENGLIVEIGDIVLKKACFAAQNWRKQGIFNGRVAVNLSSKQFALPDLQQRIESILRLTQLPAANLELEITEGTVIKEPEKAIKVMQQLSRMGVSLALDDFGTGYSSLSYLKQFPIHTLKIDKAFVDDIDKSDRDLKMVDSIITIAHNMGLSVVGEGVEETSQLNILKALKCEEIQGFIFSKAVTEQEFTKLLHKDKNKEQLTLPKNSLQPKRN
ncbi:EAL domain-containing protein [Shewanella sairae]|uniref:EAL domain-containing protein n=1 Tax=Shewanella sairae TaxID=190310 RepID=UPI00200E9B1E|nr:EAL domain-containing protein [Shewanella sairae]MCL1132202.1 EAL domain-containing protein [Shewanella sairae]